MRVPTPKIQTPDFVKEHAAVEDLLEKGEISKEEAQAQHARIKKASMEFVILMKGGKHGVKKNKKSSKSEITLQREQLLAQKRREFADLILSEQAGMPDLPDLSDGEPSATPELPAVHFSMPLSTPVHLVESSPPPES